MTPVLIINNDIPEKTKVRVAEVYKNEVFKDIDLYTHKHVDSREDMGPRSGNAVSSDVTENVDGAVIARYVGFRDAQLRQKIAFALADERQVYANDQITLEDNKYHYFLVLPEHFKDNTLRSVSEFFHRFLVFGALADWYRQFGMFQQSASYESQLDDIVKGLIDILRPNSIVKRPLQPFGPAQKIY